MRDKHGREVLKTPYDSQLMVDGILTSKVDYNNYCADMDNINEVLHTFPSKTSMQDGLKSVWFEEAVEEDIIKQPAHYARFLIEPITFIMRNKLPFHVGNIIKYVCRAGYKLYDGQDATQSEITDLKKVMRYAEMRINQLNGDTEL